MKTFDEITFDFEQCRAQFDEFRMLLEDKDELAEAADVLPFFRTRLQLSALLGMFNPRIALADRVAYEFDIFGDFKCDWAVGEWDRGSYCFIEFENAEKNSIFEKKGTKATKEWGQRFDHGFSQIVDWCHKLHDRARSDDFLARFGKHSINYEAVLVIGRDQHLDAGERARLNWRSEYVVVNSKKVHCMTFDQLLSQLSTRLGTLSMTPTPLKPVEPPKAVGPTLEIAKQAEPPPLPPPAPQA